MDTAQVGTYALIIITLGLLYAIWRMRQRNLANAEEAAVAGDDELAGGAKDPEAFEEPDDDALDEMQDLLESAAESQGLTYEE